MKNLLYVFVFVLLLSQAQAAEIPFTTQIGSTRSFVPGESLIYNVHYSWLDAGIVTMKVDPKLQFVNGSPCYKIDVHGESKGLLYLFLKMKNHFSSYIDSINWIPQQFYRDIHEGKYRKNEKIQFDHKNGYIWVEELNDSGTEVIQREKVNIGQHVQDIVSNWYVLRNVDFSQVQVNDILHSPIFFDNVLYEKFQTKFLGRKTIKTKLGTLDALVLAPLVPFSSTGKTIFAGENSVELFLSNDENKIPLKIKVKLLVGAVEIDLVKCEGLRTPLVPKQHKKKVTK